ncbi:MAG: hypothetical protein ACOCPX_06895 [Halapricum sp.]
MSLKDRNERVDLTALQTHLAEALDRAESDSTKFHLREAYQKTIILEEEQKE